MRTNLNMMFKNVLSYIPISSRRYYEYVLLDEFVGNFKEAKEAIEKSDMETVKEFFEIYVIK